MAHLARWIQYVGSHVCVGSDLQIWPHATHLAHRLERVSTTVLFYLGSYAAFITVACKHLQKCGDIMLHGLCFFFYLKYSSLIVPQCGSRELKAVASFMDLQGQLVPRSASPFLLETAGPQRLC